jgi:hypothetical protein
MLLSGSARPDATFCETDLLACGFIDAARTAFGLSVPEDLCVVGFAPISMTRPRAKLAVPSIGSTTQVEARTGPPVYSPRKPSSGKTLPTAERTWASTAASVS